MRIVRKKRLSARCWQRPVSLQRSIRGRVRQVECKQLVQETSVRIEPAKDEYAVVERVIRAPGHPGRLCRIAYGIDSVPSWRLRQLQCPNGMGTVAARTESAVAKHSVSPRIIGSAC